MLVGFGLVVAFNDELTSIVDGVLDRLPSRGKASELDHVSSLQELAELLPQRFLQP